MVSKTDEKVVDPFSLERQYAVVWPVDDRYREMVAGAAPLNAIVRSPSKAVRRRESGRKGEGGGMKLVGPLAVALALSLTANLCWLLGRLL